MCIYGFRSTHDQRFKQVDLILYGIDVSSKTPRIHIAYPSVKQEQLNTNSVHSLTDVSTKEFTSMINSIAPGYVFVYLTRR